MYIRKNYLDQLIKLKDTDFIKVITGIRRSGKSVLLQQYAQYLVSTGIKETQIAYLNLEANEHQNLTTAPDLERWIKSQITDLQTPFYLLIDEIQMVADWQKTINSFRVSFPCDIVITGSNARMLSGELATLLSGRYVEIVVYPFSFSEFLAAKKVNLTPRTIDKAYLEYEKYGGFPAVTLSPVELRPMILSGIYDSVLLNDIATRGGVKDIAILKRLVSFLADNVGQLVNSNRIANLLKNERLPITNHTVNKYLQLLQDAYLFYEVKPYDLRGRAYLRQNAKYFLADSGLRNQAVGYQPGNRGNRLENLVYLELIRRGHQVDVARIDRQEIDFLARKDGQTAYYQVTYQLPDSPRETENLLLVKDNFKKYLITGRYPETENIAGVEVKYIADWLLEE